MKFAWIWMATFFSNFRLREPMSAASRKNDSSDEFAGMDMRPNMSESAVIRLRMGEFIWKQKVLDIFMDPNKSVYEKMQLYERIYLLNHVSSSNLFAGGLMDDWTSES